jgi:hypothetical protein
MDRATRNERVELEEAKGSNPALSFAVALGYLHQPRATRGGRRTLLLWNVNNHADRHGQGCPPAPATQHSGGADLTAALHR